MPAMVIAWAWHPILSIATDKLSFVRATRCGRIIGGLLFEGVFDFGDGEAEGVLGDFVEFGFRSGEMEGSVVVSERESGL